jgi:hypothetical protein
VERKIIRRVFWVVIAVLWVIIALRIRHFYLYGKPGPSEPGTPTKVTP